MGGVVTSMYAAKHPEDVAKLTLICPAGEFNNTAYNVLSQVQTSFKMQ